MKQYTMFVCDVCGEESREHAVIECCQAKHLGLDSQEKYQEWQTLDATARYCTAQLSRTNNEYLRSLEEDAYEKLLHFEKENQMEGL